MKSQILNVQSPLWQEILRQLRHDVYHLPHYLALEARRTQTTPEAILITEGDNILFVPYLRRPCSDSASTEPGAESVFDITSPYGYPGVLLNEAAIHTTGFPHAALDILQQVLRANGVCSIFLRLHPLLSDCFADVFPPQVLTTNGETVSIDLTLSEAELWAHTRKGHQSTINKCKRLNLTARIVPFQDHLCEFMEIYEETMDRVSAHDMYYFGKDYFTELFTLGEKLHLGIVESENQTVCASLFFECCGIVQAHLGGTRTAFLSHSPFNLLLHHVRLWAKGRGNKFLHIGGGLGGSKEDKLFRFKSGFSRQRHQFTTLRLITNEDTYFSLVKFRAQTLNTTVETLLNSSFFPAYRAT
jgi:hypothetical protein